MGRVREMWFRGSEATPAAISSIAIPTAAEGPELELSVPAAASTAAFAAVSAAAVSRFAFVLDRADVEGRVDRLDRLIRLGHRAVLPDVQPDVLPNEGHVAVVHEHRLVLLDLTDLLLRKGQEDRGGVVPDL